MLSLNLNSNAQFCNRHPIASGVFAGLALSGSVFYYLYNRNLNYWKFRLERWGSYEIEEGVRCNKAITDWKLLMEAKDSKVPGLCKITTVYECLEHGAIYSKDGPCLGRLVDNFTRYEWLSYNQVKCQAELIGKFLCSLGVTRQQSVGIYASNSPEWVIAQLGCASQALISVALYHSLDLEIISHSINEVEMRALFCDCEEKLKRILQARKDFPHVKMLVLLHDKVEDAKLGEQCKAQGIEFFTWSQALAIGAEHLEINNDPPTPDDIFVIQYTSGTTGIPKGVIITHRNMVASNVGSQVIASMIAPPQQVNTFPTNPSDTCLLFLPLAHVYGQHLVAIFLSAGASIGFSSGNPQRLLQDAQILKPTYLPVVPRIMNRVYTNVLSQTKSGFKGWLFWKCYERKRLLLKSGIFTRNSIYDWIAFHKLQKMLGGRVRIITAGSAPMSPEVLEFWRVVFGTFVSDGYGQTETTAIVSCTVGLEGGNVGYPFCCCMIRLLDLLELGYTKDHDPPQGEICVKGPVVTPGYYKSPDLTNESFTPDGWFRTGDIGEFLPNGTLRIIDRKKHIFKLSQGEYIAPERIESVYAQCPLVAQVFVDGNSLETYAVAVVVPDEIEAKLWADKQGLQNASLTDICGNKDFQRHVLDAMLAVGKHCQLNSLEQVKALHLQPEPFLIADGLLTPTMKNRRAELRHRFQSLMDQLYKAGPMRR